MKHIGIQPSLYIRSSPFYTSTRFPSDEFERQKKTSNVQFFDDEQQNQIPTKSKPIHVAPKSYPVKKNLTFQNKMDKEYIFVQLPTYESPIYISTKIQSVEFERKRKTSNIGKIPRDFDLLHSDFRNNYIPSGFYTFTKVDNKRRYQNSKITKNGSKPPRTIDPFHNNELSDSLPITFGGRPIYVSTKSSSDEFARQRSQPHIFTGTPSSVIPFRAFRNNNIFEMNDENEYIYRSKTPITIDSFNNNELISRDELGLHEIPNPLIIVPRDFDHFSASHDRPSLKNSIPLSNKR